MAATSSGSARVSPGSSASQGGVRPPFASALAELGQEPREQLRVRDRRQLPTQLLLTHARCERLRGVEGLRRLYEAGGERARHLARHVSAAVAVEEECATLRAEPLERRLERLRCERRP